MEYYRLISGQRTQCARNQHVELLLSCACPPIDTSSNTLFADLQKTWSRIFFSKEGIIRKFGDDAVLNDLLGCRCPDCKNQRTLRRTTPEAANKTVLKSRSSDSVLVLALAVLVYLDKLHFFYRLAAFPLSRIKSLHSVVMYLSSTEVLEDLIDTELGRKIFESALKDVVCIFEPEVFEVEADGFCRGHQYLDSARFPFLDTREPVIQGSFGTVIKFHIPEEYLHSSIKRIMDTRYSRSIKEPDGHPQYRFVRKVIKLHEQENHNDLNSMEDAVTRLVSMLKEPAATNLITLLAFYSWRNSIYFVFPCVETDLYALLRQNTLPGEIEKPTKLEGDTLRLPDHWLWIQMIGVVRALCDIHAEMKSPHGEITGHFIASHFDLKPANILVTADGVLKITDFGESVIRVTESLQDLSTPFRPGDAKYAAPESKPTGQMLKQAYEAGPEGGRYQVLLSYDVWALACVMTEVLVVLLDTEAEFLAPQETAIDRFHRKLEDESQDETTRGTFLEGHEVKPYVRKTLEGFLSQERFSDDYPHHRYMESVCDLLLDMFKNDNRDRPPSIKVLERLNQADSDYRADVENQRDPLAWAVRKRSLKHRNSSAFREVGWRVDGALLSFVEIDGVTLTTIEEGRTTARGTHDKADCRFQLFYRASELVEKEPEPDVSLTKTRRSTFPFKLKKTERQKPPDLVLRPSEFILKWAISPRGRDRQDRKHEFGETHLVTSEWSFTPLYAFNTRFECTLFKNAANGRSDVVLRFVFDTLDKVQSFQAVLLHYTVQSQMLPAQKVTFTEVSGRPSQTLSLNAPGLLMQVWGKAGPFFLPDPKAAEPGPSSGSHEDYYSIQTIAPPSLKALVFLKKGGQMAFALPLPSQVTDKIFSDSAEAHGIACKLVKTFDFFPLISIPPNRPQQDGAPFLWNCSIPLTEDLLDPEASDNDAKKQEVKKLKRMELVMETKLGYDIVKAHVSKAWSK
ncbi:kinase-like domain-containing protein [Apiosordaria backusii]|uniref:Kinase-like domain-containing protein n=1 Tax=Apiosordaria backusii TaxID=314023 RepID=A0AA40EMD9_9PEZI|nr:kinase-like domain-containing protein [Apiosordaria backusii]